MTCSSHFYGLTPDWTPTIWATNGPLIEVEVGSTATFSFDDISNGDCPYAIFVDSNLAKDTYGAAWSQYEVSMT